MMLRESKKKDVFKKKYFILFTLGSLYSLNFYGLFLAPGAVRRTVLSNPRKPHNNNKNLVGAATQAI